MDIVGPLEKSSAGYQYILVVCDYATRFPEAFPLRSVTTPKLISALVQLFSRVGIPEEILTDQGTNFTSNLMRRLHKELGITAIRNSPYHPETDGLVERFNQTLKRMLRKFVSDTGKDWDKWLPFLLQRSTASVHRILTIQAALWVASPGHLGSAETELGGESDC